MKNILITTVAMFAMSNLWSQGFAHADGGGGGAGGNEGGHGGLGIQYKDKEGQKRLVLMDVAESGVGIRPSVEFLPEGLMENSRIRDDILLTMEPLAMELERTSAINIRPSMDLLAKKIADIKNYDPAIATAILATLKLLRWESTPLDLGRPKYIGETLFESGEPVTVALRSGNRVEIQRERLIALLSHPGFVGVPLNGMSFGEMQVASLFLHETLYTMVRLRPVHNPSGTITYFQSGKDARRLTSFFIASRYRRGSGDELESLSDDVRSWLRIPDTRSGGFSILPIAWIEPSELAMEYRREIHPKNQDQVTVAAFIAKWAGYLGEGIQAGVQIQSGIDLFKGYEETLIDKDIETISADHYDWTGRFHGVLGVAGERLHFYLTPFETPDGEQEMRLMTSFCNESLKDRVGNIFTLSGKTVRIWIFSGANALNGETGESNRSDLKKFTKNFLNESF